MLGRAPIALVLALIRAGRRDLRILSLPNPLPAELLVAAGAAARVELLFNALTLANRVRPMPAVKRAIEAGRIAWAEHDGYRVVQRLRAAGMGLPFLPAPEADISELAGLDPPGYAIDPFTGARVPGPGRARVSTPTSRWSTPTPPTTRATSTSRTRRPTCW